MYSEHDWSARYFPMALIESHHAARNKPSRPIHNEETTIVLSFSQIKIAASVIGVIGALQRIKQSMSSPIPTKNNGTTSISPDAPKVDPIIRSPEHLGNRFYTKSIPLEHCNQKRLVGAVAPVSLSAVSLLVHSDTEVGLRLGQTGHRGHQYEEEKVAKQLFQFRDNPEEALTDVTTMLVVHSLCSAPDSENDPSKLSLLLPKNADKELYMAPATISEAQEFLGLITYGVEDVDSATPPAVFNMDEPSHVVAWAGHLMSMDGDERMYERLLAYQHDNHVQVPSEQQDWNKDDLKNFSAEEIHCRVIVLLQQSTKIRVSFADGERRGITSCGIFAGNQTYIDLLRKFGVSNAQDAEKMLQNIQTNIANLQGQYGCLFFAPSEQKGCTFSSKEVVLCLGIGMKQQFQIEKGEVVGLGERALYVGNATALFDPDPKPWTKVQKGNDWILERFETIAKDVFPEHLRSGPVMAIALNFKGIKGAFGKLKSEVALVLMVHVMSVKWDTRRKYLKSFLPPNYHSYFLKELNKIVPGWHNEYKSYEPSQDVKMRACCFVVSFTIMLMSHSMGGENCSMQPIIEYWRAECAHQGDGTYAGEQWKMNLLATFCIKKYYLPTLDIMDNMKHFCEDSDTLRWRQKNQWLSYAMWAQQFSTLSTCYVRQGDGFGDEGLKLSKILNIPRLCMELAEKLGTEEVTCESDAFNKELTIPGTSETRVYKPEMELHKFRITYCIEGHDDPHTPGKATLEGLAQPCGLAIDPIDPDSDGDEEDDEAEKKPWPELLDYSTKTKSKKSEMEPQYPQSNTDPKKRKGKGKAKGSGGSAEKRRKTKKLSEFSDLPEVARQHFDQISGWLQNKDWGLRFGEACTVAFAKKTHRAKAIACVELGMQPNDDKKSNNEGSE